MTGIGERIRETLGLGGSSTTADEPSAKATVKGGNLKMTGHMKEPTFAMLKELLGQITRSQ